MDLRKSAYSIMNAALEASLPDTAVHSALKNRHFSGTIYLVAIGKAAWQMASAAHSILGTQIADGIVITKYEHVKGSIGNLRLREAGHPVPDNNSFLATKEAITLIEHLQPEDTVLFLVSGGGSALFESPLVPGEELEDITKQLLASGADIVEINTIRKRLSSVKGGKFAQLCSPAKVYAIILSDIIGDPLDMIASGPAYVDNSTCEEALAIAEKYNLRLSDTALQLLKAETPKQLHNVETVVTGSVSQLCISAADECERLGFKPQILTSSLCCNARDAGSFLASIAQQYQHTRIPLAFIAGGETVVHLTGTGLGGRNQELALAAAKGLRGIKNAAVFSVGSDGTDGPTDAAGGYVDGKTFDTLLNQEIQIDDVLYNNNAYYALKTCDGLIITGPTGTNVNDISVLLLDREDAI